MSNYYPNRDMLWSGFPTNWTLLKRLMWVRIATGGGISPEYETVTGNPVTFQTVRPAPLRQLKVAFSPVQDLHGYDNPWPAGGGKNKLEIRSNSGTASGITVTMNSDGSVKVNGTASATVAYALNSLLGQYLEDGETYILNGSPTNSDPTKWKLRVYNGSSDYIDEGNGVSFTFDAAATLKKCDIVVYEGTHMDNVVFWPMIRLASVTDPAFAPYSNICPISGWSSLTVEQRGKNLLNPNDPDFGLYTIGANGSEVTRENNRIATGYILCKAGVTVTADSQIWSGTNTKWGFVGIAAYDESKQFLGRTTLTSSNNKPTYTTPAGTGYIRFFEQMTALTSVTSPQVFADYEQMLAFGEVTEYVPYNLLSRTISISLGQTVYSGKLDVLTGVLKVRPYFASYNGETLVGPWMSSMDKYVAGATPTVGAQVVDMGGAETTIQLTPQQVSSLLGENNMWSDANGDLTVEYRSN